MDTPNPSSRLAGLTLHYVGSLGFELGIPFCTTGLSQSGLLRLLSFTIPLSRLPAPTQYGMAGLHSFRLIICSLQAVKAWLPEFSRQKTVWGPMSKPQVSLTTSVVPMTVSSCINSTGTCYSCYCFFSCHNLFACTVHILNY